MNFGVVYLIILAVIFCIGVPIGVYCIFKEKEDSSEDFLSKDEYERFTEQARKNDRLYGK